MMEEKKTATKERAAPTKKQDAEALDEYHNKKTKKRAAAELSFDEDEEEQTISKRLNNRAETIMQASIDSKAQEDATFKRRVPEPVVDPSDGFLVRRKKDFEDALQAGKLRWNIKRPLSSDKKSFAKTSFACFITRKEALELHVKWVNDDHRLPPSERCVGMVKLSDVFYK